MEVSKYYRNCGSNVRLGQYTFEQVEKFLCLERKIYSINSTTNQIGARRVNRSRYCCAHNKLREQSIS